MDDKFSQTLIISVTTMTAAVVILIFLFFMATKNRLCEDLGRRTYARELTWAECLVL